MKKYNGFALVQALLILIALGLISGTGWYVWKAKSDTNKSLDNSAKTEIKAPNKKKEQNTNTSELTKIQPKDKSYSLKVQKSLLPSGTCTKDSNMVLLAMVYNSESYDYDCTSPQDALSANTTAPYSNIAFGSSANSIISNFGTVEKQEKNKLVSGQEITKYTVTNKNKKTGGTDRYVIYETGSINQKIFYAVYGTGVGFADEDKFLQDFNQLATGGWSIP